MRRRDRQSQFGRFITKYKAIRGLRGLKASFSSAVRQEDGVLLIHGKLRRRGKIVLGTVDLFVGDRPVAEVEETLAWV